VAAETEGRKGRFDGQRARTRECTPRYVSNVDGTMERFRRLSTGPTSASSTLAEYIEAKGGRLEMRAMFRDREVRITQFEDLTSQEGVGGDNCRYDFDTTHRCGCSPDREVHQAGALDIIGA